jgi:hypothetical protein
MYHADNDISLFVPLLYELVRLDNLFQWEDPVDHRF